MKTKKQTANDELNRTHYSTIQNIWYCICNTAKVRFSILVWCVLLVAVNVTLPLLTTYLPKVVLDRVSSGNSLGELVMVVLAFTGGIALLSCASQFLTRYIGLRRFVMIDTYLLEYVKKGLTTDYRNQENEIFRKLQSYSLEACINDRSPLISIYSTLPILLTGTLGLSVYWAILSQLHILVVVFLMASALAGYFLKRRILHWMAEQNRKRIGYQQRMGYISKNAGELRSAKDIRLYHMAKWFSDNYNKNMDGLAGWYRRLTRKLFGNAVYGSGISLLRETAAYLYLIALIWRGQITVADFVLYFGIIAGFSSWLDNIFSKLSELNQWNLGANYYRSYLEYPDTYRREGGKKLPSDGLPKEIELRNVSYKYEGAETDTLHHFSLKVKPGEHLAIVGLNGAGKTTLVKLICGLTDPTEGQVLYDGVDIQEYNRQEYYRLVSAVFQQYSILPVAIEEIVAETTSEKLNPGKVEQSLKSAGLWDKIQQLPQGVHSQYGRDIFDDGIEFSGGEVQKLLLARALYKSAPLLVLDEPTAALDPIAESKMYQNYSRFSVGKTALFISHRLASTSFCDRVILIDNGAICEEGTHDSLLALKGKYYELFEMQAKYYREKAQSEEAAE